MATHTTQQICQLVEGELHGPGDLTITGVEQIDAAGIGQLTFIGDDRHAGRWPASKASAALVTRGLDVAGGDGRAIIVVDSADLAMSAALALFAPPAPAATLPEQGTHTSSVIDPSATIGPGVRIGAHAVVGPNAVIGASTVLYPGVVVLDHCRVGDDCVLWPGVVVRERCTIGDRCVLHPNVTIGADGFGYRPAADGSGLVKIPQIGTVQIGDDVEIGAGTCVDRGKFSATVIGSGSKIDNLCQIAHNCRLGRHVILAGQVGLAGSVTIGDGAMLGGKAAVADHVTIGAGAVLMACAAVMGDVPAGEVWGGLPARERRTVLRETVALRKLPELIKAMRPRPGS